MTHDVWFIADTHTGQDSMCQFESSPGVKLRPWSTAAEMDEAMLELWNAAVKPGDRVYVLGDVGRKKHLGFFDRAHGVKNLVDGNHDDEETKVYLRHFKWVRAFRHLPEFGIFLTHIPVHPSCLNPKWGTNVHGHTHSNGIDDPRYLCVSVEQIGFRPIHVEDVLARIAHRTASMAIPASAALGEP